MPPGCIQVALADRDPAESSQAPGDLRLGADLAHYGQRFAVVLPGLIEPAGEPGQITQAHQPPGGTPLLVDLAGDGQGALGQFLRAVELAAEGGPAARVPAA